MGCFQIRAAIAKALMSLLLSSVGVATGLSEEIVVTPHVFQSRWHLGKPLYTHQGDKILVESNHSELHVHSARDLRLLKSIQLPDRFAPNVQLVSTEVSGQILVVRQLDVA